MVFVVYVVAIVNIFCFTYLFFYYMSMCSLMDNKRETEVNLCDINLKHN